MTETFSKHRSKRNLMEETHVPTRTRRHNPLPTRADDTCHDKELSSPWNSSKHHSNQFPKWAGKGGNNTMIYRDNSEANAFSKWSELKDNCGRISRDSSEKSQSPNWLDMEAANRDSSKRSNWGHQPPKWLDMEAANNDSNKSSNWGHQSPKWLDTDAANIDSSSRSNWVHQSPKLSDMDAANKDRSMSSNWGHQSPKCSDVEAANKDSSKSSNRGCRSPKWSDIRAANKDSSKAPNLETVSGGQTAPQDVNFNRKTCGRGTALDNTGFDAWRRCSSSISPRGGWNRSYRSRSRSPSYGSKCGSESQVTKARIEMGGSAAPCRDFAAGRYGRGSQCRYLHVDGARRYSDNIADDIRESKRGKYSGHGIEESFTDSWERGDYSRDRRPQRHGSDFSGEDKHEPHRNNRSSALCYNFSKGRCHRGSRCKYVHHDASSDGGRFMKAEAREGTYDRRDSDTSCGQRIEPHRASNIPCKYFAEGHCRRGEDCSFSHQGMPHGHPEGRSSDHKWGYNMETDNSLSWNGAKLGDRTTTKDAPRSSRWRSDGDKWGYNKETDNGLSWNGPKRGDETTTKDAPNFSRWRSEDVKRGHNTETANSLQWNGPKWGDETTTKDSPNSSQWRSDADKQGSNVENDNSLSWNGPNWGDQTTAKDAANSSRWGSDDDKQGYDLETDNSLSWNGPKWGDHITAKDAPNSSQWRLDDDKQNYNVKTGNSLLLDDPKGGDQTTTKDSPNSSQRRSDDDRRHDNVKTDNNLSRNGSKWGDQTTTKDATSSSPWSSAADKWGYNVETDNSSSWNGPKWGDQTTANDAPNSSRWRSDVDKQGYNVQTDKTSWNGPKWGDNRTTKDAPKSSQWRSDDDQLDYNVKSDNSLSRDGPKWGDQTTTKVSPNSSQQRSDDDRRDYNVKTDNSLSRNGSKWGDQTATEDAPNSSRWRSNADERGYNMEGDNNSSQNGPKWGDQTTTKDAPNSSQWRSDDAGSRASTTHSMGIEDTTHKPLHPSSENPEQNSPQEAFQRALPSQEQNITQEPAGKVQHVLIISQPLSRTLNFDLSEQNGQDQQSINLSEKSQQTLLPPPHEGRNQYTAHSIAPNGQDAIPQLPSNQQSLNSDRQSHQVLGNGKQLPQLSATLNPLIAEPSAAAAAPSVQPNSKSWSPEPVSADFSNFPPGYSSVSVQTKNPTTVEESQTASKSFAPSAVTGEPNNGNLNKGANLEEKLHRGYQEPKQVELSGDTAKEVNETETGLSMKEQSTAHPKDADADGKTEGNSNRNMGNEKGIRMFKFVLVEFVKDILKPSWKEGHLSKEAHKTIVKKVVDKVTGTLQGSNIPQTQENIDLYLSYSKTKLTNLVQAYLEKYAKS